WFWLLLGGGLQKAAHLRVSFQKALDSTQQVAVIAASCCHIGCTFFSVALFQGCKKDGFSRRLLGHDRCSVGLVRCPPSMRKSEANPLTDLPDGPRVSHP